jgi:hypothetical protein
VKFPLDNQLADQLQFRLCRVPAHRLFYRAKRRPEWPPLRFGPVGAARPAACDPLQDGRSGANAKNSEKWPVFAFFRFTTFRAFRMIVSTREQQGASEPNKYRLSAHCRRFANRKQEVGWPLRE